MEHYRKIKPKHFCLFLSFPLHDLIARTYPHCKREAVENTTGPQKKDCSHLKMRTALKAYIEIEALLKPCKR